jgi:hypothetical protein
LSGHVVVDRRFVSLLDHVVVPLVSQDLSHRPQHGCATRSELVSAARIAGVTAALADRKQSHKARLGRGLPARLVDLHGLVLAADDPGTRYVRKQPERVNQPVDSRDRVTLDLRLIRLAFPVDSELATLHIC